MKTETDKNQSNKFLFLFRGGADMEKMSPEELQKNMDAWWTWLDGLRSKGHFEAGEPLNSEGSVLSGKNGGTVTDGPYAEGKEEVGGFILLTARDFAHATELAKGCPIFQNDGTVEVRSVQVMSRD